MEQVSNNLRYLLWVGNVPRSKWLEQLATWAKCDLQRAEQLLRNGDLRLNEQSSIAEAVGILEEDLLLTSLLEVQGVDILQENMKYLISTLKHGEQKKMAAYVGVNPTTVSRWYGERLRPTRKHLEWISMYFGLPPHTNLEAEPIFLSLGPITADKRRQWLAERMYALDVTTLHALFPAFERLLEER